MSWYLSVLKKYAVFSGRSQRKEYWMFGLFHGIIIILSLLVVDLGDAAAVLVGIYYLATLLPTLAVTFRRLHDMDRSGWWLCIQLVPILGAIVLLVFLATDGTKGDNRFGPDPKARATQ
tara:strand:+ start:1725 stop:2081 length:357 start_codon:yes stop_codon:yes gene_type:complete